MDENSAYINAFMDNLVPANPGEQVFHQAVRSVLEAVTPHILSHPSIEDQNVMDRLAEPELAASFRVSWFDDEGEVRVNKGFFVRMSSVLGQCRGRMRLHESVNMDTMKYLALEQTFSNALSEIPAGGCAAGSDFSPKGKSDMEIMNFCQSFMTELQKYAGPVLPSGDLGVGERENGFLFGQYRRLNGNTACMPVCLDKSSVLLPDSLSGKTVALSGSGKVAQYAAAAAVREGARVVTMSDSDGFIYDRSGLDEAKLAYISEIKNVFHGSLKRYVEKYTQAEYFAGERPWSVKCDAVMACACQDEIDGNEARKLLKNGCTSVFELSGMSSDSEASTVFASSGIDYHCSSLSGERAVKAFAAIADAMLIQGLV